MIPDRARSPANGPFCCYNQTVTTDALSADEIAAWVTLPFDVLDAGEKLAGDAYCVRQALRGVYTDAPVGVYLRDLLNNERVAAIADDTKQASSQDMALVKSAVSRLFTTSILEPPDFAAKPAAYLGWIKVAYSPFLRSTGETLNFFPGHYAGTPVANSPSPVASMLTSGLVGAGLGYGAGWLGEKLLPDSWDKGKLRRTLAAVGAGLGVAPGAIWGAANKATGRAFNDNSLLNHPAPSLLPSTMAAADQEPGKIANGFDVAGELGGRYKSAVDALATQYQTTKAAWGDTFGSMEEQEQYSGPLAVNVDALGRTLWETGASPQTAGMTMGALAAAAQMPGGDDPGFVTPLQMANLAAHMGAGYLSGALVGATLGILTGLPEKTQNKLKRYGEYIGIVKSVIPKLFSSD